MAWNGERREREHPHPPLRPANPMAEIRYLFFFFFGRRVCIFLLLFSLGGGRVRYMGRERASSQIRLSYMGGDIMQHWGKKRRASSDIEYSSKKMWERKSLFFRGSRKTISLFCNNGGRPSLFPLLFFQCRRSSLFPSSQS